MVSGREKCRRHNPETIGGGVPSGKAGRASEPVCHIVGLPDTALSEARERVRGAIRNRAAPQPPDSFRSLERYVTAQVPNNFTQGTSTVASLSVLVRAWMRVDFAVLQPSAFVVISGLTA